MSGTLLTSRSRPRSQVHPTGTSFPGLVGVELRRIWWRRLTRVLLVAVVGFVGVTVYNAYTTTQPERLAQALDNYTIVVEQAKRDLPAQVAQCRSDQQAERDRSGDRTIDFGCDQVGLVPSPEDMGVVPPVADGITATAATFAAYLLAFLAFVLGASTVGAEFTSGSMSTWLTFQPRRLRTAASKLVAVGLASAALGGVALALLNAGARMVAVVNRPGSDLKIPDPTPLTDSLPQLLARVLVLVVLGGVGGACLALVLRHTSAAVLSVLGYAVAVELVAVQAFLQGRLRPWTVGTNVSAFIEKGGTYLAESCTESECVFTEHTLSYTHAWVYLLVLAVVGVVAGLVAFRRRDVS